MNDVRLNPSPSEYRRAPVDISRFEVVKADLYGWFGIANLYQNGGHFEGLPTFNEMREHYDYEGIWCLHSGGDEPFWLRGDLGNPAFFSSKGHAERFKRAWIAQNAPAKFMIEYPTTCPECGETFRTLDDVVKHQKEPHVAI